MRRWWRTWSWSNVLTPWDVKQYVYCPVIPWLAWNMGIREPETYSMACGREERGGRLRKLLDAGFKPPIRLDVEMYCPRLKLAGVVDAVTGARKLEVVEVKLFKRRRFSHFRSQLMAYALLSERCLGPTYYASLMLGERLYRWDVTGEALRQAEELVGKVRAVVESEKPPLVARSAKCASCWYRRFCPGF